MIDVQVTKSHARCQGVAKRVKREFEAAATVFLDISMYHTRQESGISQGFTEPSRERKNNHRMYVASTYPVD